MDKKRWTLNAFVTNTRIGGSFARLLFDFGWVPSELFTFIISSIYLFFHSHLQIRARARPQTYNARCAKFIHKPAFTSKTRRKSLLLYIPCAYALRLTWANRFCWIEIPQNKTKKTKWLAIEMDISKRITRKSRLFALNFYLHSLWPKWITIYCGFDWCNRPTVLLRFKIRTIVFYQNVRCLWYSMTRLDSKMTSGKQAMELRIYKFKFKSHTSSSIYRTEPCVTDDKDEFINRRWLCPLKIIWLQLVWIVQFGFHNCT